MSAAREKAISLAKTGFSISDIAFKTKVPKSKVSLWLKEEQLFPHNLVALPNKRTTTSKLPESDKIKLSLNKILPILFCVSTAIFLAVEASRILGSVPLAVLLEVGCLILATLSFNGSLEWARRALIVGMALLNIGVLCLGNFVSGSQKLQIAKQNQQIATQLENSIAIKRQELGSLIENKYIGRSSKVSQEITQLEAQKQELLKSSHLVGDENLYLVFLVALTRAFLAIVNLMVARYISQISKINKRI